MGGKAGHDNTSLPSSETKKLKLQIRAQKPSWRLSTPRFARKFRADAENSRANGLCRTVLEEIPRILSQEIRNRSAETNTNVHNFLTSRGAENLQLSFWARSWSFNFFVSDDGNYVLSCPALLPKVPPLADRAP